MKLTSPSNKHLEDIMTWFSSKQLLLNWSGTSFRYPFDLTTFTEDLNLKEINSFSMISADSQCVAFGQYYQRMGRCHVGRLVVNPSFRGKGIVVDLINQLCELGFAEYTVKECSLFVMNDNHQAIKAYQKIGFKFAKYPDELPVKNCLYMIRKEKR
ncbi:GNAT family N-acetyltransferase [Psychromonas sp. KJ10-10]|uniref:GNAT family N-acetyltransferase n=1 Tax=Psychromonas sp. KJ10-10 TaxID=3391823 RepID=UPI0039B6B2A3